VVSRGTAVQVSTLIYSMGDKTKDLVQLFVLSEEDAKRYQIVKENEKIPTL